MIPTNDQTRPLLVELGYLRRGLITEEARELWLFACRIALRDGGRHDLLPALEAGGDGFLYAQVPLSDRAAALYNVIREHFHNPR